MTHLITCQGRDHIVNIQSGRQSLVTVNVHFEPELTLRQLRDRLHLVNPHWPSYPNAVGIILGDFNNCDPEAGRFYVWNQTFTDGDPRKAAIFHSFFHTSLRLLNLITQGGTPQPLGLHALFQGLIVFFINLLVAAARDFHCKSNVFENLGNRTIPSDHAAVRLAIQKPTNRGHQSKRIPSWISKHPVFCSLLQRLHDDHRFSSDPFGALAEFKVVLEKAKKLTIRELSRKTPDSIVTMTTVFLLIRLVHLQSSKFFLKRLRG